MLSWINRLFLTEINISVHPLRWKESKTALICKQRLSLCLPGVILNPVRDDLRMMAPNPVAAREEAMKEKRVFWHIMFWNASIKSCLNSLLISCPIDRPLNAG